MVVNGDLRLRAMVDPEELPWEVWGEVHEKAFERADFRHTALVRMPIDSALPQLQPVGCIDILVLDGELRTDRMVLPVGAFVHEPAGTRRFTTESGCLVFFKQRPAARKGVRAVDSTKVAYYATDNPGLRIGVLHEDDDIKIAMLSFAPGATIGPHVHEGGEEFFVLRGELRDEFGAYREHCWVRQPAGSKHAVQSPMGCSTFSLSQHL